MVGLLPLLLLLGCVDRTRLRSLDRPQFDDFAVWLEGSGADYGAFVALLEREGVEDVVPPWHLWRQGTDWRGVGEPPFAAPPVEQWAGIVPTLRILRDEVVPRVGKIEVVSGFRTEIYNQEAGGAPGSRHRWFEAVDVVPRRWWSRPALHVVLLGWWVDRGEALNLGLGLYSGTRFHVDAWKYRKW